MPIEIQSPEELGFERFPSNLETHSTYVGPGQWFGMPDSYIRLGFGWAILEQMRMGLQGIARALADAAV